MNFFSRLFHKAQPAKTLPVAAAERRSPQAGRSRMEGATGNAVQQAAAVDSMPYGDVLLALAAKPSATQKAAQLRLAQLLDTGTIELSRLRQQITDRTVLLSILAHAKEPGHLEQVASSIDDADFWANLVTQAPATKLRQLAAQRVDDPLRLKRLLRDARGKDKNAYKIIRHKCDLLQAQEKQAADRQAQIVTLCETLERHSYKPFDGAFVAALEHLNVQWRSAAEQAPAELKSRAEIAFERAHEVISSHLRLQGAEAARAHAIDTADPQRQAVLDDMRQALTAAYTAQMLPADAPAQAAVLLARWDEQWSTAARHKPAAAADAAKFSQLHNWFERCVQRLSTHGSLQQQLEIIRNTAAEQDIAVNYQALQATLAATAAESDIQWPPIVTEAAAEIARWNGLRAEQQAAAAAALRNVSGLLRRANGALSAGRSGQAAGLRRAITAALPQLASVPGYVASQIEQLDKRLDELQDWKSFAVAPKRAQLIEQMQALIGASLDPVELADQIKRLQEEWKEVTRGSAEQSDADWQTFHEAAQTAYQPCREYFAVQAKLREDNLNHRKALVEQLVQFDNSHDWANADWKEVARVLRQARQEWRNYSPTERAANKPVEQTFNAWLKGMQDRLDAQYANHVGLKQSLIKQVQRLLNEPDTRKAIDDVKRLQVAWKSAGLVPHQEDQKLWEEFRQQCDAVYRRSQEEYSKLAAELEHNKARVLELCAQIDASAGLEGEQLAAAVPLVSQWRTQFDAVGELPRADSNQLQQQFRRAVERYERQVAAQQSQKEQQSWNDLFAASNEVRLLQLAIAENPATDLQPQQRSVQATIDGVQQWPKGGRQAIERKFAETGSTDIAGNEAALRSLCIRAEILTHTPTPAADQSLRREQQLQSLVQGLGQSGAQDRQSLEALAFEWIGVGATRTDIYYELLERFNQCWVKARHAAEASR